MKPMVGVSQGRWQLSRGAARVWGEECAEGEQQHPPPPRWKLRGFCRGVVPSCREAAHQGSGILRGFRKTIGHEAPTVCRYFLGTEI